MKDVIFDMLISFAKTGNPTIKGVNWEPTKYEELTYLNIDGFEPEYIKLRTVKELSPRAFWRSLGLQENENLMLIKDEFYGAKAFVETSLGKVQGHLMSSFGGKTFSAFEGIPFAKPPIGDKRFEEPEPVEPWHDVLEAKLLTECAQTVMINPRSITGGEDCLYLNVYVPREEPNHEEKLDVIIHIHGGAFMYGSGHKYAKPQLLMDRDIIFVTFNYRLGIFGFLSTEDEVVPGNNGLKDQVLALKWVQKNIASFGGNPDSVTLTGLSAGGSSVHLHYFSEMSKGLFHRGFSQSGCALNQWTIQKQPAMKAKILAQAVGCPTNSSLTLVDCLKQKPYIELLAQIPLFFSYLFMPICPFAPVVEKGSKPFLTGELYHLLREGQVQDLPWIMSNTAHEGLLPAAFLKNDLETVNKRWDDLAPILLDYNYTLPLSAWKITAEKAKQFYLGDNQDITHENFLKFVKLFTDRHFLMEAEDAVKMQANVTQSPVYYYFFGYPGDNNADKTVAHGGDRKYFFGKYLPNSKELTPNELKMKDVLLDMLVAYAKTGKPVIDGVTWEPTSCDKLQYLNMSGFEPENMKMQTTGELSPRNFWESLELLQNKK
ncbi:venom carboxylesterase-6-like [Asbolus verrucosus]|uniref:Carboxylic ester hydrolase n=1 Tax=Asbolus verrucosus TaxID=1661398 RepID=A0A482V954_ASBVE|nr:venom carboxylesterase-6-like [Asbolus verrucosus]